jgi:hypothetical protein
MATTLTFIVHLFKKLKRNDLANYRKPKRLDVRRADV